MYTTDSGANLIDRYHNPPDPTKAKCRFRQSTFNSSSNAADMVKTHGFPDLV